MVLRRSLHVHVRGRHVGSAWERGNSRGGASVGLRRVGIRHAATLRLESRRHATSLSGTVSELVVGRVTHLVVVVGVVTTTATSLGSEVGTVCVVALNRVSRFASVMGTRLSGRGIRVGRDRSLSHVALWVRKKSVSQIGHSFEVQCATVGSKGRQETQDLGHALFIQQGSMFLQVNMGCKRRRISANLACANSH